jgi:polyhydroxyalkanoate synthesis regulator protein
VPRYLEVSIQSLTREQEKFRQHMSQAFGAGPFAPLEDQVRRNMEMFERAFTMFAPFARREAEARKGDQTAETEKPPGPGGEIDDLKRQLDDMQKRLDRLSETKG